MVNYVNYGSSGCIYSERAMLANMNYSRMAKADAARGCIMAHCGGPGPGYGFNMPLGFGFGCPMPIFGFGFPPMGIWGAYGTGFLMGSMIGQTIGLFGQLFSRRTC